MPLSIMPLKTQRLQRARLIKNIRLESVIEMYAGENGASAQVDCSQIHTYFSWKEGFKHPDQKLLTALGKLPSYDVFSTRIALRNLGIELENVAALQLSVKRTEELNKHMRPFIAPLLRQMLDNGDTHIQDFDQLTSSLRRPDRSGTYAKLKQMSDKLQISVQELPKMLEDYADIFLSVAYYQEILDNLLPRIAEFLDELDQLRRLFELSQDTRFHREAEALHNSMEHIVATISARFEGFYRVTNKMWVDINGESFGKLRTAVIANQTLVGGILCGLTVKIRGWEDTFGGQPLNQNLRKRVQFIQNELRVGIEKMEALETLIKS